MRRTLTAAAAAALTLGLVAGPAAAKPDRAGPPAWAGPGNGSTIVQTAIDASGDPFDFDSDGDDFDVLVAALVATGVVGIFDGETDYTVFAPNDAAFYALTGTDRDEDAFNAAVALLGVDGVAAVLAYHVTEDWRPSPSVLGAKKIEMLDGNTISAKTGTIVANNSTAGFVDTDLKTNDGGIHVIDAVLLP